MHYGMGDETTVTFKATTRFAILKAVKRDYMVKMSCVDNNFTTNPRSIPTDFTDFIDFTSAAQPMVRALSPTGDTEKVFKRTLNPKAFFAKLDEFYLVTNNVHVEHDWDCRQGGKEFTKLLNQVSESFKMSPNVSPPDVTLSTYLEPVSVDLKRLLDRTCYDVAAHTEHLNGLVFSTDCATDSRPASTSSLSSIMMGLYLFDVLLVMFKRWLDFARMAGSGWWKLWRFCWPGGLKGLKAEDEG